MRSPQQQSWLVPDRITLPDPDDKSFIRIIPTLDEREVKLLKNKVKLHDIFFIVDRNENLLKSGVFFTAGFPTLDGWTAQLLVRVNTNGKLNLAEAVPNHHPLTGMTQLSSLEFERLSTVICQLFPRLSADIECLRNWARREWALEEIYRITSEKGCSEEEERQLFKALKSLLAWVGDESRRKEDIQTVVASIMSTLHAENMTEKEWNTLWERLIQSWRTYVSHLTESELARVEETIRY
ncbi:hypothetical protein J7K18_01380 [bacterium]|nr:hypothetical protein [bacterium]